MKLMQLQRTMARAVMQPLTSSERMQRRAPDGGPMKRYASRFIKPNDRLTSFERLEIYNRQYWFRVLAALGEDFPGLRAVLGERRFDAMAKAYLIANPSRSFTLRNLGSRLESWLRKNPKWAGANQKLALDIVRLEWADIEAFDGKAEPALRPEDLSSAAGPRMRLTLQPYVRLLSSRYPVDDLLLEVRKEDEDTDFASNTFQEHRKRKRVRAVAKLKPAQIFLAVHRIDYTVYFRRIEQEEFAILTALRQGKTLGAAVEAAFRKSKVAPEQRPVKVQSWFASWSALGWFCRPEKKRAAR
ncbi:MAG: DNA-binding domain-containing protein [Candidatus Acidiferrum sp.]